MNNIKIRFINFSPFSTDLSDDPCFQPLIFSLEHVPAHPVDHLVVIFPLGTEFAADTDRSFTAEQVG